MGKINKITLWIKDNKFPSILIAILFLIALKKVNLGYFLTSGTNNSNSSNQFLRNEFIGTSNLSMKSRGMPPAIYDATPHTETAERMVVENSNISVVVENVNDTLLAIKTETKKIGGYMVNSSIVTPEGLAKGSISVRIPVEKLSYFLSFMKDNSVKIVSEEISGRDVTDEYMDTDSRITTLKNSKIKYEEILNSTNDIEQILIITNKIINLEQQIDSLIGRQQYLEQTSKTSLVRINLATNELELPYSPEKPWSAKVIFKYAVRSLVSTARKVTSSLIWLVVYSIIWAPILAIFLVLKRRKVSNLGKKGHKKVSKLEKTSKV